MSIQQLYAKKPIRSGVEALWGNHDNPAVDRPKIVE